jgi:hypothetical protein
VHFRIFETTKWSKDIVTLFGFKDFPVYAMEAGIEAPCQLILQIYIAFCGIRPDKYLTKSSLISKIGFLS